MFAWPPWRPGDDLRRVAIRPFEAPIRAESALERLNQRFSKGEMPRLPAAVSMPSASFS
jgi:hypothetical protein